ncbi:MAG TPA: T9SS type A sorting domain-containing protein [candidate division Zixibacteria bacterium]
MKRLILCLLVFSLVFSFLALQVLAKGKATEISTAVCNDQLRVQRMANLRACFSNWGFFGSESRSLYETTGGCFMPNPSSTTQIAASFEFPKNSDLEYLYQGGLWIGAIVNNETLTTVGVDGWQWINEIWPDGPSPLGDITEKSQKPGAPCSDASALADQEMISVYSDTLIPGNMTDPFDKRFHKPINLKTTQHTYSWETPPYDNFVIVDLSVKNIGTDTIHQTYLGLYMDTDIGHTTAPQGGSQDDITGFLKEYNGDTVNIGWAADNDGDPTSGVFNYKSPTGVIGVKLLDFINPVPKISYNWWTSNAYDGDKDWGPWKLENAVRHQGLCPYGRCDLNFPDNVKGTPGGDLSKYFIMSNGEIDYDQIYSYTDMTDSGWLSPSFYGLDFARGIDTKFLFSFGPVEINPNDSIYATLAFLAGDSFHTDVNNYQNNLANSYSPSVYYSNLNFSKLVAAGDTALSVYLNGYTTPPIGPPDSIWLANMTNDDLKIMWGSSSSPSLASFNIYRDDVLLDTNIIDTFYVDTSATLSQTYDYAVSCVKTGGKEGKKSDQLEVTFTDVPWEKESTVPLCYALEQNYPNPFNASTEIRYYLLEQSKVKITVYNTLGQKVRVLVDSKQDRGWKNAIWNGKDQNDSPVASGIYFYRIATSKFQQVRKMVFLK